MSSIFNSIFKYRQRELRTPREDYFTETFVAVIESYEHLRIAMAAWLLGIDHLDIQRVRIETQRQFRVGEIGNRRRPDIWMEVGDASGTCHWIIVENKIDSGEGENQLADYADRLRTSGLESRTLVYITKYFSEPIFNDKDSVRFKPLRWSQVYDFLRTERQNT